MFEHRVISLVALALLAPPAFSCAQETPMACAWEVSGEWRVPGRVSALKAGDLLPPGSLLTGQGAGSQHLIMLLPDGQRLFLDCHDRPSCSRGFRLPALTQHVDEETIAIFQQVSAMRHQEAGLAGHATGGLEQDQIATREHPDLMRVEAVAALGSDGSVNLAAAFNGLPPGDYHLLIKSTSGAVERSIHLDGGQKTLGVSVSKAGLYDLRCYGTLNTERMHGHLLVVHRAEFDAASHRFARLKETLDQWNERSPGWPIHEFLFLYLEAIDAKSSAT